MTRARRRVVRAERRLRARRGAWALAFCLLSPAGCGPVEQALAGHGSTCQQLDTKLLQCPELFGPGVNTGFLAEPRWQRAHSTLNVYACALRLEGASPDCVQALEAFVSCAQTPACSEVDQQCASQSATLHLACAGFFPRIEG